MNILITSAGQRVSLVRAFQKESRLFSKDSKIYTTDLNPALSAACNVSDHSFKVGKFFDIDYIPNLLKICRQNKISLVVPTIDTELILLSQNKNLFESYGIHIIISDERFVSICRNKIETNIFFNNQSIQTPKFIDKKKPTFPLFIKPIDGSSSHDTFVVEKSDQLLTDYINNDKLLFLEYISKKDNEEYTVDLYYGKDHQIKCIVPRRRIKVRAGEVSKGVTSKNMILPFIRRNLGKIEGAIGCLTLQLFMNKSDGSILGIEINPRFGGGYPLAYISGANYPNWLIQEYLFGKELEYWDGWEDKLLMLRYDDEIIVHNYAD